MNKQNIILTGGLGYIGSHIYLELISDYNVIIIDNLSNSTIKIVSKLKQLSSTNVVFYPIDLLNKQKIDLIFNNYKPYAVIHLAGFKSVGQSVKKPLQYYQNNLISTLNLLESMKKHNCFNLVFSSSCTVYGDQKSPLLETDVIGQNMTNPYGRTKIHDRNYPSRFMYR